MDTNKILIGGLIGFVATFILGFLFYGVLLTNFFESNGGSATNVMRADDAMLWIPLIIGHISIGFLLAIILGRWAGISTFSSGAMAGALIGFLIGMTQNMIMYATTNITNLNGALADVVLVTINCAIAAGLIGLYYGSSKK